MTHRPRKRFGQHFLVDEGVVDAIVAAVDAQPGQVVVEIGPGLGALTRPLRRAAGALTVVELDRDLAARWRDEAGIEVIEGDVLKVDLALLSRRLGARLRVVGNLPYNVSTPILFHLAEAADDVLDQHVMLQAEVAERIAAAPASRAYGRLSVMLQWRYAIELLLDVPPAAFDPPPKVDSTVLVMTPKADPPQVDRALLGEIVTIAFSQRRKLLRHTLGRWLDSGHAAASFDVQRRAEEVPVEEYVALASALRPR